MLKSKVKSVMLRRSSTKIDRRKNGEEAEVKKVVAITEVTIIKEVDTEEEVKAEKEAPIEAEKEEATEAKAEKEVAIEAEAKAEKEVATEAEVAEVVTRIPMLMLMDSPL